MFGIMLSALNAVLAFVLRSLIVKFVVFFALYFITTEFISVIVNLLPTSSNIDGAFGSIGSGSAYFLDVFYFKVGISMVISAYVTRFIIRRIPVIG